MIKYRICAFKFDFEAFSRAIEAHDTSTRKAIAEAMGLSVSALDNWINGYRHGRSSPPLMLNFVRLCNLLDLDPRDYFVLDV